MSRQAQLPDGTILDFPNDTPDAVIDKVARSSIAQAGASQPAPHIPAPRAPTPAAAPGLWDSITATARDLAATAGRGLDEAKAYLTGPDPRAPTLSSLITGQQPSGPDTLTGDINAAPGAILAAGHRAINALIPSAASVAGFGAGAAAAGAATSPFELAPGPGTVVNLAGGLIGGLVGAYGAKKAQSAVAAHIPQNVQAILGQDDATQAADQANHPIASFIGGLAPNLLAGRPGLGVEADLPAGSSAMQKVFNSRFAAPAAGAVIQGGTEAGSELAHDGKLDPVKVGIAAVMGGLQGKQTRLGAGLTGAGASTVNAGVRAATGAREAFNNFMAEPVTQSNWTPANGFAAAPERVNPADVQTNDQGFMVDPKTNKPYSWQGDHKATATFATRNNLAGDFERVIVTAPDGGNHILLQRRGEGVGGAGTAAAPAGDAITTGGATPAIVDPLSVPSAATSAPVAAPGAPPPTEGVTSNDVVAPISSPPGVEPAAPAPLRPEPGPLADGETHVTTPAGNQIRTRMGVVDASQLTPASGDLQNRDRSRAGTDLQVQDIVSKFDPARLGPSAETDRGAPIVGPDGIVESGNGRILALNKIYDSYPQQAQAYRDYLQSQGHDTAGMDRPVLVRQRMTDMTPEQRRQFVIDSNTDTKLAMGSAEQAKTDATSLTPATMALYRGGDVGHAVNTDFVSSFLSKIPAQEQAAFLTANGSLSADGIRRIKAAITAGAYGDGDLLGTLGESADNNIKAVGGALEDNAPAWLGLRHDIASGHSLPQYDITPQLVDAAKKLRDLRNSDMNVKDWLAQEDMLNPHDPVTVSLMKAFHNDKLTRGAGRDVVSKTLERYIARARAQLTQPGFFPNDGPEHPADLINHILAQRASGDGQGSLLAADKGQFDDPHGTHGRHEDGDQSPAGKNERGQSQRQAQSESAAAEGDGPGGSGRTGDVARRAGSGGSERGGIATSQGSGLRGSEGAGLRPVRGEVANDNSGISTDAKGSYQDSFIEASYTNRTSIYAGAIHAVGLAPKDFALLTPERKVALLSRALTKITGIAVTVEPGLNRIEAIDQLLDAHQTLQGMAHVLGITPKGLSLGGKLALSLTKNGKGKALGVFDPGNNQISLPGRSNSFAHEWSHALDFHLLDHFGAQGRGLSGAVRKTGADFDPQNIREAFVHLMNAMFFDNTAQAAKALVLEAKIAAAKSAKVKADAQAQLDRMADGSSQSRDTRSAFYHGAKSVDKADGDYWTQPTEMMARAFEAYVSAMAGAKGLGTEFIGKDDASYQSTAEARFAKTFPKGEERERIFSAIGDLMIHLNNEAVLDAAPAGSEPDLADPYVEADLGARWLGEQHKSAMQKIAAGWRRSARLRAIRKEGRGSDPKTIAQAAADMRSMAFDSMAGTLKMIEARYAAPAVGQLHDMLINTPGGGKHSAQSYAEEVQMMRGRLYNQVAAALEKAHYDHSIKDLQDQLNEALRADTDTMPDRLYANIKEAALAIRKVLDAEYYRNRDVGVDMGYATGVGYLKRQIDHPRVFHDEPGFIEAAGQAYGVQFDRAIGEDGEAVMAKDGGLAAFIKEAKGSGIEIPKELKKVAKRIAELEGTQPADNAHAVAIGRELDDLKARQIEIVDEMHAEVRQAYGQAHATAWLAAMKTVNLDGATSSGSDNSSTKSRVLPPATDRIMRKFYVQDPVQMVSQYIEQSVKRVAYARRFGADNSKRNALFAKMTDEGVSAADQGLILNILNKATGRDSMSLPPAAASTLAAVHLYGTITLLPRAVLASLTEPIAAGMTSGDFRDGITALAHTISGPWTLKGTERGDLARAMGLIAASHSEMGTERFGGDYGDSTRMRHISAWMYEKTGLTGLTDVQRAQGVGVSNAFLDRVARDVIKDDEHAKVLLSEFGIRNPLVWSQELVARNRPPDPEEFSGKGINKWAEDYALASLRFANLTIQEPSPMMRQYLANNSVGRVVFGIQAFNMSFYRSSIQRYARWMDNSAQRDAGAASWKRAGDRIGTSAGARIGPKSAAAGAKVGRMIGGAQDIVHSPEAMRILVMSAIPSALMLFGTTLIYSWLREKLLNNSRIAEWERQGTMESNLAQLAFQRAFPMGSVDPIISAYTGLKYQRDLSNVLAGPAVGFGLQQTQRILDQRDSAKTNTHAYNRDKAIYAAGIAPLISLGLSIAPGGPEMPMTYRAAQGLMLMGATAPGMGDAFATVLDGPKGIKTDSDTGAISETRDDYAQRLRDQQDRRIAREAAKTEAAGN